MSGLKHRLKHLSVPAPKQPRSHAYTSTEKINRIPLHGIREVVTLKRLYDNEYIDKTPDGYYHARADREDLYRYTAALEGLYRMTSHEASEAEDELTEEQVGEYTGEAATLTEEDIEEAVAIVDPSSDEAEQ